MKFLKWLLFTTVYLLFFILGCGRTEEMNETPTPTGIRYENDDLFETGDSNETSTPDETVINGGDHLQGAQITPQETENLDYVIYDAANRYRSPDPEEDMQSLFCIDKDTGVVYFVNQNEDWYIYRLTDGKTELTVELPARELYMLNGTLYFIVEDYDKYEFDGITEGDIYAYKPANGSVTQVLSSEQLEGTIEHIMPYEDGIALYYFLYQWMDEDGTITNVKTIAEANRIQYVWCFYSFADGTLEADPYRRSFPGWGDYYMMPLPDETGVGWKTVFWSRETYQKDEVDLHLPASRSFVIEDTIYAIRDRRFYVKNLITEEQQTYDVKEIAKQYIPLEFELMELEDTNYQLIFGFTATKDSLWVIVFEEYLLRISLVDEETDFYKIPNARINKLYTDGIHVYTMYVKGRTAEMDSSSIVRLCTEEAEGSDARIPIINVEYLTE